jgi:hypothetical protein
MPEEGSTGGERSTSFLDTCKSLRPAITSALHTRLELLVTELEEERERLKQTLLLTLLLFFSLRFGFILLNIFAVAVFWERGWGLHPRRARHTLPRRRSSRSCDAAQKETDPTGPFRLQ